VAPTHILADAERTTDQHSATEQVTEVVGFADIAEFPNTSRGLDEDRLARFIDDFETDT
jgi:hypothetical protein